MGSSGAFGSSSAGSGGGGTGVTACARAGPESNAETAAAQVHLALVTLEPARSS